MYNSAKKVSEFNELVSSFIGSEKLILSYSYDVDNYKTEEVTDYYYIYNNETGEYSYTPVTKTVQTDIVDGVKTINQNFSIPVSQLTGGKIASYYEKVSNEDGGLNTAYLKMDNNTVFSFSAYNGSKGETGMRGFKGPKGDKGQSADFSGNVNNGTLLRLSNDAAEGDKTYMLSAHFGFELNKKLDSFKEKFMHEEQYQALASKEEETNYYTFEESGVMKTNKVYSLSKEYNSSGEPIPVEPEEHTITFKDGEEIIKTVTGKNGTYVSVPNVTKEGYEFMGWSPDGEHIIIPADIILYVDVVYIAMWEKIQSTEPDEPTTEEPVEPTEPDEPTPVEPVEIEENYYIGNDKPTLENISLFVNNYSEKPEEPKVIDMNNLNTPTLTYIVYPLSWEVVENDILVKPVIKDENGFEIGSWYDEETPIITYNETDYRILNVEFGKMNYTIEF